MYDYHIHLERGSYDKDWLLRFIEQGVKRGIEEFGIVEHLYVFKEAKGLLYQNEHVIKNQIRVLDEYISFIEDVKRQGLPVKLGLEVDYIPSKEQGIADFVKNLPLDFVIGSVHYLGEWAFDLDSHWPSMKLEDIYQEYYCTLTRAAQSGIFDILGHSGNIAYFGYKPDAKIENELVVSFAEKIAETDIILEINTGGLYRPAGIVFPELRWLPMFRELGIDVITSSDAHSPEHTGWEIGKLALPALKEAGYGRVIGFTNRAKEIHRL